MRGCDESIERARFAHDRRNLGRRLGQHLNLRFAEKPRLHRLNYQNPLQNSPVDEWNSEERLVIVFAGFLEVFKARVSVCLLHSHWPHLFRH